MVPEKRIGEANHSSWFVNAGLLMQAPSTLSWFHRGRRIDDDKQAAVWTPIFAPVVVHSCSGVGWNFLKKTHCVSGSLICVGHICAQWNECLDFL